MLLAGANSKHFLTMGSLFDGIGGFPLASERCGITPLWASEIEAFPIEVTKRRFPYMLHVGDITNSMEASCRLWILSAVARLARIYLLPERAVVWTESAPAFLWSRSELQRR